MKINLDKEDKVSMEYSIASYLREAATVQTRFCICQNGRHANQDPVIGEADRNRETFANRTWTEVTSVKFSEKPTQYWQETWPTISRYATPTPHYSS